MRKYNGQIQKIEGFDFPVELSNQRISELLVEFKGKSKKRIIKKRLMRLRNTD